MNSFVIVVLALVAAAQANAVYKRLKVEGRIVGGEEAVPHSFPYQAYLFVTDPNSYAYPCGGTLLTPTKVLTAARCVKGYDSTTVFLGAHDLNDFEESQQIKQVVSSVYHAEYNEHNYANDIAIVTLDSPAEINENVQLTRLPTRADVGKTYVGEVASVSGWGVYSDTCHWQSQILRVVSSPVVSNAECSKNYGYVPRTQICISGKALKSSCNGDSGNPLVIGEDRVQIGIVSYHSLAGCEKGIDSVYTRVTEYLDWIEEKGGVQID